jgi:hypothetical protein
MSYCRKKRLSGTRPVPAALASRWAASVITRVRARFDRVPALFFGKLTVGDSRSSHYGNLAG